MKRLIIVDDSINTLRDEILKSCNFLTEDCYSLPFALAYFYPFDLKNGCVPFGVGSPQYCYKPWASRLHLEVIKDLIPIREYEAFKDYWNYNLGTWRAEGKMIRISDI